MADLTAGRARPGAMAFVLLTVALSWLIWITVWLATGRPAATPTSAGMVIAIYAGSFAPGIAAAIVSGLSPPGSLKEWARGFIRFRCGWRAYAATLLPLPLSLLLLTIVLGYEPRLEGLHGRPSILLYPTIFPVSIFNGLATAIMGAGPLGEEGGWRGYLLPRLLDQGGEARAALIIGIIWALWHLPVMAMFADWRGGVPFLTYLPLYTAGVIGLQRDNQDASACCLTRRCSRGATPLPHHDVPYAFRADRIHPGSTAAAREPEVPLNTSAIACSDRQIFRRRWTVRNKLSG